MQMRDWTRTDGGARGSVFNDNYRDAELKILNLSAQIVYVLRIVTRAIVLRRVKPKREKRSRFIYQSHNPCLLRNDLFVRLFDNYVCNVMIEIVQDDGYNSS